MNTPQVIKFANEGLRPAANNFASAYFAAKSLLSAYDATGMQALLGDDPQFSNMLEDGSESDGRPRISAGGVKLTVENIRALVTQLETVDSGTGLTLIQGILSISPQYRGN